MLSLLAFAMTAQMSPTAAIIYEREVSWFSVIERIIVTDDIGEDIDFGDDDSEWD